VDLPSEARLRWLLRGAARLLEGGAEPVSGLILPTAEFFPDPFDGRPPSVARLLARVAGHAGLSELPIKLELGGADGASGASCSSGSCSAGPGPSQIQGRVRRAGQGPEAGFRVTVTAQEVRNATVLTTALVRASSEIFLAEARLFGDFRPGEAQAAVDLGGVLLGFGVLLANGSHIYSKGCGGVRISSATALPVDEITVALAVYAKLHGASPRAVRTHLDPTPRARFDEAVRWAEANAGVVGLVRSDRAALEADTYALSEARGWLSRLLGIGRARGPTVPTDDEIDELARELGPAAGKPDKAAVDPEKQRRLAEIRALVDESFDG